jgi:hypothetical protein
MKGEKKEPEIVIEVKLSKGEISKIRRMCGLATTVKHSTTISTFLRMVLKNHLQVFNIEQYHTELKN